MTKWFSWGPYTTIEEPLGYIGGLAGQRERGEQLDLLVVHRTAGPVGITGLSEFSSRNRHCMVGTWFGKEFWGTGVIRDFGFAMNVGVLVGTYSSVFVASPVLIWLNEKSIAMQKKAPARAKSSTTPV